jgi:GR25 family glycosyltransferase involved in LPS biosynthesis
MKYEINVINLDRNKDRWRRMESQLKRLKGTVPIKRFSGIDGRKLESLPEIQLVHSNALLSARRGFRISHDEHNYGSIGCYFSHLGVWKMIVKSGDPFGVVFEDDISVPADFHEKLVDVVQNAPKNWEMIQIGPYQLLEEPRKLKQRGKHLFINAKWILFNAYIMKASCCKKLIEKALPVEFQVDWWVTAMINSLKLWVVAESITGMADFRSDINHTPVIPEYLLAQEMAKYDPSNPRKKQLMAEAANSNSDTKVVLIIIISTGVVICMLALISILLYYRRMKLNARLNPSTTTSDKK